MMFDDAHFSWDGTQLATNKITIGPANLQELGNLDWWWTETGVDISQNSAIHEGNVRIIKASQEGILGSALGTDLGKRRNIASQKDKVDAMLTRYIVSSIRLNGQPIGIIIAGPPTAIIYELLVGLHNSGRYSLMQIEEIFWRLLLNVAKLEVVAISPDHRGRGHGMRLVRHALDIVRKSGFLTLYGEYVPDRSHLSNFYSKLGFQILPNGKYLDLSFHSGAKDLRFGTRPAHENIMFSQTLR